MHRVVYVGPTPDDSGMRVVDEYTVFEAARARAIECQQDLLEDDPAATQHYIVTDGQGEIVFSTKVEPKPTYEQLEKELDKAKVQLVRLEELLDKEQEFQREYRAYGTLADKIANCFAWYRNNQERVIGGAKVFNEDMILYMRAIALVAEMVGNAGTHAEKNARLRGLIEQIESAIHKLREQQFNFRETYYWRSPDVWRSDYPLRRYMEQKHDLQRQLDQANEQIAALKGENGQKPEPQPDNDIPL